MALKRAHLATWATESVRIVTTHQTETTKHQVTAKEASTMPASMKAKEKYAMALDEAWKHHNYCESHESGAVAMGCSSNCTPLTGTVRIRPEPNAHHQPPVWGLRRGELRESSYEPQQSGVRERPYQDFVEEYRFTASVLSWVSNTLVTTCMSLVTIVECCRQREVTSIKRYVSFIVAGSLDYWEYAQVIGLVVTSPCPSLVQNEDGYVGHRPFIFREGLYSKLYDQQGSNL